MGREALNTVRDGVKLLDFPDEEEAFSRVRVKQPKDRSFSGEIMKDGPTRARGKSNSNKKHIYYYKDKAEEL